MSLLISGPWHVRKKAKSLPLNKAPGPDKVSAQIIKDCLPVILGPLTEIINCSILTIIFPNKWKEAEVISILKGGDYEEAANNRPLSLLTVASKVCEKIVLSQSTTYLLKHNRLTTHQSGHKKALSTETLNVYLTDRILEAMNRKNLTALVLLDLSKAFDSIQHQKLLLKLSPSTVNWFKSYLSGALSICPNWFHSFGTPANNTRSPTRRNHLCFSASTSTICPRLLILAAWSHTWMTRKYSCHSRWLRLTQPAIEMLEQDLRNVAQWCCANNLLINSSKTKLLFIGTRHDILLSWWEGYQKFPKCPSLVGYYNQLLQPRTWESLWTPT